MSLFDPKQNSRLKAALPYIRKVYTSLFASLTAVWFAFIILEAYVKAYRENSVDFQGSAERIILIILFPILIIGIVWLVFNYFDNLDLFNKRDYIERRKTDKTVKQGKTDKTA